MNVTVQMKEAEISVSWHHIKGPLIFQSSLTWQNSWPGNREAIRIHSHVCHELHILLKTEMSKRQIDNPRGPKDHAVQICTHAALKANCYLEAVVLINCNVGVAEVWNLAYKMEKKKEKRFVFSFLRSQADTLGRASSHYKSEQICQLTARAESTPLF